MTPVKTIVALIVIAGLGFIVYASVGHQQRGPTPANVIQNPQYDVLPPQVFALLKYVERMHAEGTLP